MIPTAAEVRDGHYDDWQGTALDPLDDVLDSVLDRFDEAYDPFGWDDDERDAQ